VLVWYANSASIQATANREAGDAASLISGAKIGADISEAVENSNGYSR
jgi:hypothetical protein